MDPDLILSVARELQHRLAGQPHTTPEHLSAQLGLSLQELLRMADNDPSVAPERYLHVAVYLGITPELVQMLEHYRLHG
ncbi:hypothetical protein [Gilvimarinus agarilyticus]|uniref:hypothetical protein n=1 Tax=Gilvimarinus agarilyticus TaxID=679259 RepID=UPI00059F7254|nr:hypothetical protein [Gilvimarinus agarilyticus]